MYKGRIYRLNKCKKFLNTLDENDLPILPKSKDKRELLMSDEFDYERMLLKIKEWVISIIPNSIYNFLVNIYRKSSTRVLLRKIRDMVVNLILYKKKLYKRKSPFSKFDLIHISHFNGCEFGYCCDNSNK